MNYIALYGVIKLSVKQTFKWTLWKWLITGSVGSLLNVLKIGKDFAQEDIIDSVLYGLLALTILFSSRFILLFGRNIFQYLHEVNKNAVYGDAIVSLKDSFAELHNYRKTPGHQDQEFMLAMSSFCENLKKIYDNISKSDCCVSIKVSVEDAEVTEHTAFKNILRNQKHEGRDTKEYESQKHTLIGNTAFSTSFNKVVTGRKERFYINNHVNSAENYENTSKKCFGNGILPYNSELVHPIVPIKNKGDKNFDCMGFICVDSDKKDSFVGLYDVAILEGVADGIYDLIVERNKAIKEKKAAELIATEKNTILSNGEKVIKPQGEKKTTNNKLTVDKNGK